MKITLLSFLCFFGVQEPLQRFCFQNVAICKRAFLLSPSQLISCRFLQKVFLAIFPPPFGEVQHVILKSMMYEYVHER